MFYFQLLKMNIKSNYVYKSSFYSQILTMLINNIVFLIYWLMFFSVFKVKSITLSDIFYIYSVVYVAFGLTQFLAGNLPNIATLINTGSIDMYILQPRSTLLYLIMSKSSVVSLGDIMYGLLALFMVAINNIKALALWPIVTFFVMLIIGSYYVIVGTLAFFIGNSRVISDSTTSSLIMFATYPQVHVGKILAFILTTIIPSLLISIYPLKILKGFDGGILIVLGLSSILFVFIAHLFFYMGLKHYDSTNTFSLNI